MGSLDHGCALDRSRSLAIRTAEPTLFVALALAGVLLLMGCGGNSQRLAAAVSGKHPSVTASGPASRVNDADVKFVQQMILHHQQAIQMAQMAASHAQNPKVKALAAKIQAEQASEIRIMTGWLHAWGQPVPTGMPGMMSPMPGMMSPMPGMMSSPAPGTSGMPGMMSQREMSQLMAAHGVDFDQMFLQMMISHHRGAVEMARTEQAEGVNPAARKLARQIEIGQTAEIARMQKMLKQGLHSPA